MLAFDGWKNILNQHIFGSLFIISSEYPYIVFLPCFTHQCQLAICDNFKESLTLKTASAKAITAAAYFKNGNNSYFIGKLQDIQKELSLVWSKQALRNLAIWHEHPQLTPEANSSTSNMNKIYLNNNICKILLDNDWWNTIEILQEILMPYCGVLNKLQSDKARLFELLHDLEKWWSQWEQPLLLLSFILHPKYRLTYFNSTIENLSFTTLERYLTYYYKAWFQKRPTQLLVDFKNYRQKNEPFDDKTFNQFGNDVFKFWKYVEGDYKELAGVALRIFGICVNSASIECIKKELQKNQAEFLYLNTRHVEIEFSNLQILDERELAEWKEILIEEEVSQLEEEEALRDNPGSLRGNLLTEYTHPAIDTRAKWQLKTLFSSIINIPAYLKTNKMV
ncbi:ribonuclease H-like domain-containing protein [Rhizophagus clarus]|uniref:Ribonuclease H-like domain-containing protein n=1 Tax=Rhizophagus clarus TaxID=94130 RepID=A0A8H3MDY0_9GLOM|nr:ribonuclease H-like domain-containing protein [Rhizophagus clarus]